MTEDRIYSVYEAFGGRLYIGMATVIKRGKQLTIDYESSSAAAFRWGRRVAPDKYATTVDGAVAKYREMLQERIIECQRDIDRYRQQLNTAPKPLPGVDNTAAGGNQSAMEPAASPSASEA